MTNKDQHPAILYKYIDTTGGLSMLQKEELWFRRTGFLNDPYDCYLSHECQGKYPEFSVSFDLNELTKYFGICSLSETATTFLMWSYYNEHKGMCIGVNMKDIYTSLINHFHDKINSYLSFRKVVSEVKTRINLLKEECKKRNANIKPNVLSILEKERQNLIEKKAHDAKLNPFK